MPGRPDRQWRVPLSDIAVDDELVAAAGRALASGWWSTGPRVAEFEAAFARSVGVEHAVAVSSGTAALHLAAAACGCGPGDEVVMPSLNFVAAANVIGHLGATPVLCDVGELDPSLDPDDLDAVAGPRTRAIVALHYGGVPCDMAAVRGIAARRGLVVIEDAAHAPGAEYRGRACGTLGDVGCFSFFSNKNLPIGEGGMVVTADGALAERVRRLRSHGMTALSWDHERGHAAGYDVAVTGFNYRLDEPRAAIGPHPARAPPGGERRSGARWPSATASDSTASPGSRCRSPASRRSARRRTTWPSSSCRRGASAPRSAARSRRAGSRRASTTRRSTRSRRTRSSPRARFRGPTSSPPGCSRCRCSRTCRAKRSTSSRTR